MRQAFRLLLSAVRTRVVTLDATEVVAVPVYGIQVVHLNVTVKRVAHMPANFLLLVRSTRTPGSHWQPFLLALPPTYCDIIQSVRSQGPLCPHINQDCQ
ncbi:hypothetical protein BC835DRAFT_1079206 [Cytidiella melzeri]|nr:hypothetical protein BC835DRAFT_1079206 [Cytidiella melzeri]